MALARKVSLKLYWLRRVVSRCGAWRTPTVLYMYMYMTSLLCLNCSEDFRSRLMASTVTYMYRIGKIGYYKTSCWQSTSSAMYYVCRVCRPILVREGLQDNSVHVYTAVDVCSFCRSAGDSEAHEYIALDADIQAVQEFKRPFAFRILCKGVSELCFSAEDEETLLEWLSRLNSASKTYDGGLCIVCEKVHVCGLPC